MRIFLLLLLFVFTNSFSQDFLPPKQKKSFGLNRHTNRDISYFSNIDNNNDIIITATTERDSTFTDILVTKLDKDLKLIWKKTYSVGIYTSDDTPLATHIDNNNNIIIVGRNVVNNSSNATGILFAVCYSPDGVKLWHLNFDDPNAPKNYNYYYQKSFLDEDNILHVVNSVNKDGDPYKIDVNFYSINSSGHVFEKFTRDDIIQYIGYSGVFNAFYYHDGIYYMVLRRYIVNTSDGELFIKKVDKNSLIDLPLNPIIDSFDIDAFEDSDLQFDKNNNLFLSYSSYHKGFINVLKFNSSLELIYKNNTAEKDMRHILSSFLDSDDNFKILNSIDNNALNNPSQLSLLEFNDKGLVQKETIKDNIDILRFKKNEDKSFFIETKNGDIKIFDRKINLINDFKGTGLEINDICKLDNTLILAATTYGKAYPTSDFLTELDVVVQKIDKNQLLAEYRYSGEGTSKAFTQKVVVDNKDNYIVFSEEKLGPDNEFIGGSRGPLKRNLYKYDSNLNLLWTIEIPYNIVTPLNSEDKNILIDSENNIYINAKTENNTYKLLKISEQGIVVYDELSYQAINLYFDKDKNVNVVALPTTYDGITIYTFNSVNGKLLNTKVFGGLEYLGNYTDKKGDSYVYMFPGNNNPYDHTNPRIEVYKNLNLEFERKISLEGKYAGIIVSSIDSNGTIFLSSSYGSVEHKLHRLNLLNEYKFINVENSINKILCTAGDKNFIITEYHNLSIYNKDLEIITQGTENYSGYGNLFELGDYVLINTPWDNLVKVVDKKGQLIKSFKLPGTLNYTCSAKDSKNSLILTGKNGQQIYTYSEYSWWRGFLHKYDILDEVLGVDEFNESVIYNDIVIYPNPSASIVYIAVDKESIVKLQLYDFSGQLITSYFDSNKIDISKLPNALYFIKVQLTNGKVFYKKIIKN